MHAHEPLRYVGDMLAWVHQAIAGERDFFSTIATRDSLQGQQSVKAESIEISQPFNTCSESKDNAMYVYFHEIFEDMSPLLKVRVQQAVEMQGDTVVGSFEMLNLLDFFLKTTQKLSLPKDSALMQVIMQCMEQSRKLFVKKVEQCAENLLSSSFSLPTNLSTFPVVSTTVQQIVEILKVRKRMRIEEVASEKDNSAEEFVLVLDSLLNPLLRMCLLVVKDLDAINTAIFMINNLDSIQLALKPYNCTTSWVQKVVSEIDSWVDVVVEEQSNMVLQKCEMKSTVEKIKNYQRTNSKDNGVKRVENDCVVTEKAMKSFYSALFTLTLPSTERLTNARIKVQARNGVARKLCNVHDIVYDAVSKSPHQYPDTSSLLLHSPEQVKTLLDV